MQIGRRLSDALLFFGEPEVDATGFALQLADDFLCRNFERLLFHLNARRREVDAILLAGHARLRDGLIERRLRLLERGFLFGFFFTDKAPTKIYTLSLHDALPI